MTATITVKPTNTVTRWPCLLRHAADCSGETDKSEVIAVVEPDDGDSFVCQRCLQAVSPDLAEFAATLEQRLDVDLGEPPDMRGDQRAAALGDWRSAEVDAVDWRFYCAHSCQCCNPGDRPCCDCGRNHHRDGDPREDAHATLRVVEGGAS